MRAAAEVERTGIRSVAIVGKGFDMLARTIAKAEGLTSSLVAVYPGIVLTDSDEVFERKVNEVLVPLVLEGLTGSDDPPDPAASSDGDASDIEESHEPSEIVASGDYDDIQEHFLRKLWTDGLPIVPPTRKKVFEFVDRSGREPDEVLAVLAPTYREATVWSVAANAVMAGCRPEYMPLLIALVECIGDPEFRLQDAGSTPGWEPMVIVSGPVVERLDFNSGAAALRIGRQANSAIGRFTRLYMRNVGGYLTPPGTTDMGGFGMNFHVALAENDEAIREIGWPTLREDEGFDRSASTVSVQSVAIVSGPIYSAGARGVDHLETITPMFRNAIGPWAGFCGYRFDVLYTLLVMCPSVARVFAEDGWSKDDVRAYLGEHMTMNAAQMNAQAARSAAMADFRVETTPRGRRILAARGIDPETVDSAELEMPALIDIDKMAITVAGNPARNQSRAFVGNHGQGVRITKQIRFPD